MGFIIRRSETALTRESVFDALCHCFPEFTPTGDYFANRIARQEQIATDNDMPLDCVPLASTRDAARRLGPQPAFDVTVNPSLFFSGRLSKNEVMLHSNRVFSLSEARQLCECLESIGLELETCCG